MLVRMTGVVLLALLVGCGGGEDAEAPAAEPSAEAEPAGAASPTTSTAASPGAAGAGGAGGATAAVEVTAVSVSAPDHAGTCPVDLAVSGIITASGPGTVTYNFVRNDGFSTPLRSVPVVAGENPASATWKLGSPGAQTSGWAVLEVISPTRLRSEQEEFTVACDQPATRESPKGGGY